MIILNKYTVNIIDRRNVVLYTTIVYARSWIEAEEKAMKEKWDHYPELSHWEFPVQVNAVSRWDYGTEELRISKI